MRKITFDAVDALFEGQGFKRDSTEVIHGLDGAKLFLHNNLIAVLNGSEVTLNSCGWKTSTTKERLNGVLSPYGFTISQKKGVWFLNDVLFRDGMVVDLDTKEIA